MDTLPDSQILKILFLEDEIQDVELMRYALESGGIKNIFKQVVSKKDFLEALDEFNPDVIIADYSLPMFNGMHAFQLFKEKNISIPFILATGSLSEEVAMECLSEGVDDFILKSSFTRLPLIIKKTLQIKRAEIEKGKILADLEKKNEELKILNEKSEQAKTHELLSNREFEILCMIASGKSIKEIADQLFLSPATIATYRARLLEKMGLKSNVQLAQYAIRNKLIE